MAKCMACGKFLPVKGGAACSKCNNKYHLSCALLPESTKVSPNWRCVSCKRTGTNSGISVRSGNESEVKTPSPAALFVDAADDVSSGREGCEGTPTLIANMGEELRLLRSELVKKMEEVKDELIEFRREMGEIRQAVSSCTQRVDVIESRLAALEKGKEVHNPEAIERLENTVALLKSELNDREQDLLLSDVEISNLPEVKGENVLHTVELVAQKLGVPLETRDIIYAERVGPVIDRAGGAGEARGRCIVARLARRALRDELLRSARVRRGATSADLGLGAPPRRFYLNERLTRANKQLYYRVRKAASLHNWRYTWTKHGRIFARQTDGKRTYTIHSAADLERFFNQEPSTRDTT